MTAYALWNALEMAFAQLWRNRSRTLLTSLGILIGVGSVIMMVGIGQGASASIQADLSSFGVNLLMAEPGTGQGPQAKTTAPAFKLGDVDAIRARVPNVGGVAPDVQATQEVVALGESYSTSVTGTNADYLAVRGRTIAEGRNFTENEGRSGAGVCVLGETVRDALFGTKDALGAEVRVGSVPCTVIGILDVEGENMMGMDQDDLVLMPMRTVQSRILGSLDVGSISVSAKTAADMDQVRADIDAVLRERRGVTSDETVNFSVHDTREMASTLGNITGVLTAFLAAVAGVSLLVGGIGIMNIMLVSVTERTREIGIRMAIGALESDIRTQFLVEAGVLAVCGGAVGAALGIGGTVAASLGFGIPLVISPTVVVISVVFSGLMGVGFGWVPARNAARLEPIDALRHT